MFDVLTAFFRGEITDVVCIQCILSMNLGNQIVLKTEKACRCVRIGSIMCLTDTQRDEILRKNVLDRKLIDKRLELCKTQYRRQGRYIDEITDMGDFRVVG